MAKMYPKVFPEDSNSSGERKVFEYLKENAPSDWIVLHSFRLPKHKTVVFGEADFVVIAPKYGIFVLEIKSGGVGFDGDNWIFVNRNQEKSYKKRGPFQQCREAMFEIERIIGEKLGDGYSRTDLLYGYGVIFTDEDNFPLTAITEDETWRLCQRTETVDYVSFIKKLYKNFLLELTQLGKRIPKELSSTMAETIGKTLRPIVDCIVPLKSFVKATEQDIISLTEEQYACLDDIEINDQIVITGGAGTGKTLIAVEEAKRSGSDIKVGFFCYNKNLADFIRKNISAKNIEVYSIHSFMGQICVGAGLENDGSKDFFSTTLPHMASKTAKEKGILFDKIIVDEFQDLCTTEYIVFLDTILRNGLVDGKFLFYGDFARQAIYNESVTLNTLKSFAFFAKKHLSVNCRNTLYIGNELINVTGYEDKQYRLKIIGEPVDYYVCNTIEEQSKKLIDCIKDLKKKGFNSSSIIVLSSKRRERSIINLCDKEKFIIGDYGEEPEEYYAMFSTVQAYKGLESEIVILIDVEDYSDTQLMYIAISRARSKLIVLETEYASKQRKKLTLKR
ncbi:MAG: NERD domain-containing protein [Clostridia bacterium]|nr:NERD domain-containing protein [Clostridia bacterium]